MLDWALNTPLYWNISPRPSEMVSAIYFLREEATDNIDPFLDSCVKLKLSEWAVLIVLYLLVFVLGYNSILPVTRKCLYLIQTWKVTGCSNNEFGL